MASYTTTAHAAGNPGIRDVAGLYLELAPQLERIVRRAVQAPEPVIEDACQFAWSRLIRHRSRLREDTILGWLTAAAVHEAFKLSRRGARELSLEQALDCGLEPVDRSPQPWELLVQRERMASIRKLAVRPQRVLWLHALGLSYQEMAEHERCTRRTVERRLATARRTLRTSEGVAA